MTVTGVDPPAGAAGLRLWLSVAGLLGALAVGLGAYGAHGLDRSAPGAAMFDIALGFHAWHVLALLGVAGLAHRLAGPSGTALHLGGALFVLGMVLFCGTLYAEALAGRGPPMAAPIGGACFILGWLALVAAALLPGAAGR